MSGGIASIREVGMNTYEANTVAELRKALVGLDGSIKLERTIRVSINAGANKKDISGYHVDVSSVIPSAVNNLLAQIRDLEEMLEAERAESKTTNNYGNALERAVDEVASLQDDIIYLVRVLRTDKESG